MSCILFMLAIFLIGSKSICYKGFITRFAHLASLRDTSSARLQKLGEFSLSLVIVFTAVSNLNHSLVFSSSRSFMFFWRPKERKAPAHGKSSRHLLCSGVASNILQSKSPCHLNLSVDFWVMRTFLS